MSRSEVIPGLLRDLTGPNDPGVQYVVVDEGSVVFELCTGLADVRQQVPLSLSHTMSAFSMTKTLTAIAVLQLFDRKRLGIDDRVSHHIDHPYNSDMTVRQLLNHTSGIPNPIPLKWVHLADNHGGFDEQKALARVLKDNPHSDSLPGTKYRYSNIGYWLLGEVIEKVSEKVYADFVAENIFAPLGLAPDEIGFMIEDVSNHARGYLKRWSFMNLFGRFLIDGSVFGGHERGWTHIRNIYPNGPSFGGAIGSARAFGRILQDLLKEESRLLGSSARQLLYSQQSDGSGHKVDMTLGWHMRKLDDLTYYYKEGEGRASAVKCGSILRPVWHQF